MKYYNILSIAVMTVLSFGSCSEEKIDRHSLLVRNNPIVQQFDSLSTLTVGNGGFAFSVDATGLQTFPEQYRLGVPLGTMSDWGWHSFENKEHYLFSESLKSFDFGHGHEEVYSTQIKNDERKKAAIDFVRANPHRLHLGNLGFYNTDMSLYSNISQRLDLESGIIYSSFDYAGEKVNVETCCDPLVDLVAVNIKSETPKPIIIRMPYPTGVHSDDASAWIDDKTLHETVINEHFDGHLHIEHVFPKTEVYDEFDQKTLADFSYSVYFDTNDKEIKVEQIGENAIVVTPSTGDFSFTCEWSTLGENPYYGDCSRPEAAFGYDPSANTAIVQENCKKYWHEFWYDGAIVDFSKCKDPRAEELERRVVLSQYLMAVNCAGNTPPQETGLTYNSWFGKYHLEMIYWHQAQFALWNHPELLERSLDWYQVAEPIAKHIAERQGFNGVRWMKMTDYTGTEAPSSVGSFLIWQQPHFIYLSELVYRALKDPSKQRDFLEKNYALVSETAEFMIDFATYDTENDRYVLKGNIPAQETLRAAETINSPFELSEWYCTLNMYQQWRERMGDPRDVKCDDIIAKLSHLYAINDSTWYDKYGLLYPAAETAPQTYQDVRFTSDHMAVLGALGIYPSSPLCDSEIMSNTLRWVWDNWNWDKTWGWDYPMTAMCAARCGEPEMCIDVLLGSQRTNTYLISGHNYQDSRLRLYLPGNGGLLTAIACMCAGWDGCKENNPGFPKDGNWDVKWEGLNPLP